MGGAAAGAVRLTFAVFFLATFFFAAFRATGAALAFVFLRADFALLDLAGFFVGRVFFFAALLFAAVRFAFATGRFFALLFFFAMITSLLAVLRLPAVRVSSKKSAVT